jgi:NAD(P)-dependent dehydrogenase (short-subunit alcohol dehydrogenase family)
MLLDNKIAIVTGGGQGIGKGIAKAMAQSGAKVIIAELNKNLANVVDEIPNSKFIVCDVGDEVSVQSLINNVLSEFERIDILVNNAGIIVRKDAIDHTLNDWNNVLRVNLTGPFLMSKYTLKDAMIKQHSGCIITLVPRLV